MVQYSRGNDNRALPFKPYHISFKNNSAEKYYFLFGPEGGFEDGEIGTIDSSNKFVLSNHRLRSETAVINCASLLTRSF